MLCDKRKRKNGIRVLRVAIPSAGSDGVTSHKRIAFNIPLQVNGNEPLARVSNNCRCFPPEKHLRTSRLPDTRLPTSRPVNLFWGNREVMFALQSIPLIAARHNNVIGHENDLLSPDNDDVDLRRWFFFLCSLVRFEFYSTSK